MGRRKQPLPGKRVNIWLPERSLKVANQIDNLSGFIQLALEQAAGIMALDIIKKERGYTQPLPTPEQYDRFNADHPTNPLTALRTKQTQWQPTQPSPPEQEPW